MTQWWKDTVFYQIYMPSFCDGNQDGIGDFIGITKKLPYLKKLGVGGIWLTPFYPSPKVDQGYDISDYYNIDADYGTMQDFEDFIEKAHGMGIKVISDVVINHTSTEHPWFAESKSSVINPKRDWYIWKRPLNGKEPNNWESFFGEKAWEFDETTQMYYYHSFAKEQADLNWANPMVKHAVFEMLDFWVEKGIDGFRLDVINNLTLTDILTDNPFDAEGRQIHQYDVNQPGIHDFMRELKGHFGQEKDLFLVGEISSDDLSVIHSFVGEGQLDTTFNFNLGSMERFAFGEFYRQIEQMMELYKGSQYATLFFGSHDMARFPSRFRFDENQSKNLFTFQLSCRGIPFLYFGDEIGMENYECQTIEDARDIQGIIAYNHAVAAQKSQDETIRILNEKSRDHSRNTMYWEDAPFGGFSEVMPWINYQKQSGRSAAEQMEDNNSLFAYVAKLIELRKKYKVFAEGDATVASPEEDVLICKRSDGERTVWSVINFSDREVAYAFGKAEWKEGLETLKEWQDGFEILIETNQEAARLQGDRLLVKAQNSVIVQCNHTDKEMVGE